MEMKKEFIKVEMLDRQHLILNGVENVEVFDEDKIILKTVLGVLKIKGEQLNVTTLDLEQGNLKVEGVLNGVEYLEEKGAKLKYRGKNILTKFFK